MAIEETTWESDNEVSGTTELCRLIYSDSVSFTKFSSPRNVKLVTQKSRSKTIEDIPVDFVYNMRQTDGMSSIGWEGAGFLNGRLQYTGFTRYNDKEGEISAHYSDFLGKKVKNKAELKEAIKAYYGANLPEFRQALNSLPECVKDTIERILL